MKKIFSIGLGIVSGLILCFIIGPLFKSNSTSSADFNTKFQVPGTRSEMFGSGRNQFGSGMQQGSGMNRSGTVFTRPENRTGNAPFGSGARPGMGRGNGASGETLTPEDLVNQNLLQK